VNSLSTNLDHGQIPRSVAPTDERWIAGDAMRWWPEGPEFFDLIPEQAEWPWRHDRPRPIRPMFVGRWQASSPEFAVTPAGDLFGRHGLHHWLQALHSDGAPISALLVATIPDWLA